MRTRNNNTVYRTVQRAPTLYNWTNTNCAGTVELGTNTSANLPVTVAAARLERMTDSTGKGHSHGCKHRIHTFDINSGETVVKYSNGSVVQNYGISHAWFESSHAVFHGNAGWDVSQDIDPPNWSINTASIDETSALEQLASRARELKADVLLNIVEANQIWPSIKSLATSLPVMREAWTKRHLRTMIKTASGSFLAWKFGISPILSDMMAITRYLPRIQSDVKRHAAGDSKRFSFVAQIPTTHPDGDYSVGSTSRWSRQGRLIKTPELRYVLVVKPKTTYNTDFFKKADFAMSRFATSPASLAWERIPFSFVVDWFVDLRGALRALDQVVGSAPYEIKSLTRSINYHMAVDYFLDTKSICDGSVLQSLRNFSAEYKAYDRSVVGLPGFMPRWSPRFGKNQAGISAALISQMLSRIR